MSVAGRRARRLARAMAAVGTVAITAFCLLAIPGAAISGAPEVPAKDSRAVDAPRSVIVYGDSLTTEASRYITSGVRSREPKWDVLVQAFPGTAICDWFDNMREHLEDDPDLVVIQFGGNAITPCMDGIDSKSVAELQAKYLEDAEIAVSIWEAADVPVLFVGSPRKFEEPRLVTPHPLDAVYEDLAERYDSVRFSDEPERALTVDRSSAGAGVFENEMPCLPAEEVLSACADGFIQVRAPDGLHFCPVDPEEFHCPVYNAGGKRFGDAIATALVGAVA